MEIKTIDESGFYKLEGCRQVIAHDFAQKFGVIELDSPLGCYGISWRSDLIEPSVTLSHENSTLWIGVDQRLVAVCLETGRIYVSLALSTNLFTILSSESVIAVLTEMELIIFNQDYTIRSVIGLPDLSSEISISEPDLIIRLMDGSDLTLNIQTGVIIDSNGKRLGLF